MRFTLSLLLCGCAAQIADDTILLVPAHDIAEHHVEGPNIRLAVPKEDVRAAPRPRRENAP